MLFEVNTLGTINGTLAALELMRAAGRGHVINVVSLAGLGAPPGEALYAATKHGAIAFTLGTLADLRRAGASGIQVSAVCPDGIWTPMLHDKLDDPDAAPSFSGTLLRPETVARRGRRAARPPAGGADDPALARRLRAAVRRDAGPRDAAPAAVDARRPAPPAALEAADRGRSRPLRVERSPAQVRAGGGSRYRCRRRASTGSRGRVAWG